VTFAQGEKFWVKAVLARCGHYWLPAFDDLIVIPLMIAACEEEKYNPANGAAGANYVAEFLEAVAVGIRGGNWASQERIEMLRSMIKEEFKL